MSKPMMGCGHAANATHDGQPSCAICVLINPDADTVTDAPDLTGRVARCTCGSTRPSTLSGELAFFEYRGPGSYQAVDICVCGYARSAHENDRVRECQCFTARGDVGADSYYCGHAGWD